MIAVCFSCCVPRYLGHDVQFLHQPNDALSSTTNALCLKFSMNARTAIHAPIVMKRIFNTLGQLSIILLSLAHASFAPIEVSILGNLKHTAHARNWKKRAMSVNESKFYRWGCVKMLMAFFRISLSCLNTSFSRLSFLFSSSKVL